jgi:alkylation response protein AidB-like acyl-CoA dehydrogenase
MNKITSSAAASFSSITAPPSVDFGALVDTIRVDASRRDLEREHPFDAIDLLKGARFGALRLPAGEGGGGGTIRNVHEAAMQLAEADANVAHIYRNHFTIVERFIIGSHGGQRDIWRKAVLSGEIIGLATTELDRAKTGGDSNFKTVLRPEGDGFILNGTKFYSTGTLYADWVLVRATTSDGEGVSLIIPTGRDGVERIDDWDGIGQRVTGSGTTNFRDVPVAAEEVIFDKQNPSFLLPFTSTFAQSYVTAIIAGIIRGALRDAKALLKTRSRNFYYAASEQVTDDPLLQQAVGRIASDAFAAEQVVLASADALDRVAAARDQGEEPGELAHAAALIAAKAKIITDELALRATAALFDVGGASAATRAKNLDRHWRNARTLASHNPASYKAQALGAFELNGTRLPSLGFF